jgi:hypothetical protein
MNNEGDDHRSIMPKLVRRESNRNNMNNLFNSLIYCYSIGMGMCHVATGRMSNCQLTGDNRSECICKIDDTEI